MNIVSTSRVASTVGSGAAADGGVKQLEAQVGNLTQQIAVTEKDTKLDCNAKEAKLKALQAQLQRMQALLAQARSKAAENSGASASTQSSGAAEERARSRAEEAARRGGVDIIV